MEPKDLERLAKRLFSLMKARAKKRKKEFKLEPHEVFELCCSPCLYCGSIGSNKLKYAGLELDYNGIDRIDSSVGYTTGNSVSCCSFCNSLKGAMVPEHWFDFLNSVVVHHSEVGAFTDFKFEQDPPFGNWKPDESRKSKRYFKGW